MYIHKFDCIFINLFFHNYSLPVENHRRHFLKFLFQIQQLWQHSCKFNRLWETVLLRKRRSTLSGIKAGAMNVTQKVITSYETTYLNSVKSFSLTFRNRWVHKKWSFWFQDACYDIPEEPPGYLSCAQNIAIKVPKDDRPCCQTWGCKSIVLYVSKALVILEIFSHTILQNLDKNILW